MSFSIGAKKINTARQPVQLSSQAVGTSGCVLSANPSNKKRLFLSTSSDLPNEEQRVTLEPGETRRFFPSSNLNEIYVSVESIGDIIEWTTS